jgi:predicted transcriptional regulator
VETFFDGSLANAVAALVETEKLPPGELARIEAIIKRAKTKKEITR